MIRNFVVPFILGSLYEIAISYTQSLHATIISHITIILYRICLYVRLSYYKCVLKRGTISNSVFNLTSYIVDSMGDDIIFKRKVEDVTSDLIPHFKTYFIRY